MFFLNLPFQPGSYDYRNGFAFYNMKYTYTNMNTAVEEVLLSEVITKTRPCNIQRFFTAVKKTIFS